MNNINESNLNSVVRHALSEIANTLNNHGFNWSLGASCMLKIRGINVDVHDIDIIIKTDEIDRLETILNRYDSLKKETYSTKYPTSHFYEFDLFGVSVDVMIGFKVNTSEGVYHFDDSRTCELVDLDGVKVYLSSLEEWLMAYKAMARTEKVKKIEDYLAGK